MHKKILTILFFVLVASPQTAWFWETSPCFAIEVVDTAWVRRYDGPINGSDAAYAISVDGLGNIYVTGRSDGDGTSGDFATIKYYPNGDSVWVRRYDGPSSGFDAPGQGFALDESGNVYVTGESWGGETGFEFATLKYDQGGDTAWVRRYGRPGDGDERANDIAVDGFGNVYVTGYSDSGGILKDFLTIKYYPNGDTAWVRSYDGPGYGDDVAYNIAVDDSGNAYVTGFSFGSGTDYDFATIKYNPDGDTTWVRRYDGPAHGDDVAQDIAVDDSGNVYVTGNSWDDITTSWDFATIKYYPNGDTAWVRRYDGLVHGDDAPLAIAVDDFGNAYVAGHSDETLNDFATIKYYPNGDTAWVRIYDGPVNGADVVRAIAVDDSGNVYVTGESDGIGTDLDFATIKYNPDGGTAWVRRYDGPDNDDDNAADIAVDASGSVYVTGFSVGIGTDLDFATIKYIQYDSIPFAPAVNYGEGGSPIAVFCADLDGDGDLDLAVANTVPNVSILKNNGNGIFQSAVNYGVGSQPHSVFCADLDGDGDLDLAVANGLGNNVSILKNNGNGTFQSAVNYGAGDEPGSVCCADLDGDADLDLAVANWNSGDVSILKNNGDGTFQSPVNYGAGSIPRSVFCADLDADGDLDLAVANLSSNNVSILKNNGNGSFQTAVNYGAGGSPIAVFCADLDGDGDLDLAVANGGGGNVSILKNNGDGIFQSAVNYGAGSAPQSVFCADLDGDIDLDLAVADLNSFVSILKNSVEGVFQTAVNYGAGNWLRSVFCADLDGDGDFDLAVANQSSDNISILRNLTQIPANQPPWAFSLISPEDQDTTFGSTAFQWHIPYDPNFGDQFRYDLYVSTSPGFEPLYTTIDSNLAVSKFTAVKDSGTYYWKVKAKDNWGAETWSAETWSFAVRPLFDTLWIVAYSPVDLIVTDPVGDSISLDTNTIQDATYDTLLDVNEDGDNDDEVTIPHPFVGEYQIRVIAEPDAEPWDSFSVGIRIDGSMEAPLIVGAIVPPPGESDTLTYGCLPYLRGDVTQDNEIDLGDLLFLVSYLYKFGPAPEPLGLGDVNRDEIIELGDVLYLVSYLYKGGPPPSS